MSKARCINIDWLEVYVLEPAGLNARDAEFFRADGWIVSERSYGTRQYQEMFTLMQYGTMEPLLEVRRNPCGNKTSSGVFVLDPRSCHIRLTNRTCYFPLAAKLLSDFLSRYQYDFQRISRIDLCLDFELFDSKDKPSRFLTRYLQGVYRRVRDSNIRVFGKDQWDGQTWNSASWGAKSSAVSVKLYNKTLELKEVKDKPYIRQQWAAAGLIDDYQHMTRTKVQDGQSVTYSPMIWRLEFSIKSDVKTWLTFQDPDIKKTKQNPRGLRSIKNTLDCYFTQQQMIDIFASLQQHYFRFKYAEFDEMGSIKRKDRCKEKVLFYWESEQQMVYTIEKPLSANADTKYINKLQQLIESYRWKKFDKKNITDACNVILEELKSDEAFELRVDTASVEELTAIRLLLSSAIDSRSKGESIDVNAILESVKRYAPLAYAEIKQRQGAKKAGSVEPASECHSDTT